MIYKSFKVQLKMRNKAHGKIKPMRKGIKRHNTNRYNSMCNTSSNRGNGTDNSLGTKFALAFLTQQNKRLIMSSIYEQI